ncbi:MAG: tRNA pseudouridine(55) synthase TruB [Deltaproteobacteria bacterium]|nr:tRNA pseudouridine(55) synthase TruB [Deltaproteobacteria bacterium]
MTEPKPRTPESTAAHGLVLVDKPAGTSSNAVTRTVQRLFGASSAGHLGTLDPFATGLLVVMLGDATRLAPWLERGEKSYLAQVVLGTTTDTLDREGAVVQTRPVPSDARERLRASLPRFTGTLHQRVPDFSAAKVEGVRRADLARKGVPVEPKFKDVVVTTLSLLENDSPPLHRSTAPPLHLSVTCGPGTYIRQLVADLGEAIGCGAHTGELRRTRVGTFAVEDAVPLERIRSIPAEQRASCMAGVAAHLPGPVWAAGDAEWSAFERGQSVPFEDVVARERASEAAATPGEGGLPAVVFVVRGGRVRGVGEIRAGRLWPRRVLAWGVPLQAPGGDRSREMSTKP